MVALLAGAAAPALVVLGFQDLMAVDAAALVVIGLAGVVLAGVVLAGLLPSTPGILLVYLAMAGLELAEALYVSEATVKTHINHIFGQDRPARPRPARGVRLQARPGPARLTNGSPA
ncbi:MAG TPA: hypothetical protein VMR14_18090 [Streptosporangiaceae bacterium]|nr:hypothetical protein [Streptosporangiaceae bacterium]